MFTIGITVELSKVLQPTAFLSIFCIGSQIEAISTVSAHRVTSPIARCFELTGMEGKDGNTLSKHGSSY